MADANSGAEPGIVRLSVIDDRKVRAWKAVRAYIRGREDALRFLDRQTKELAYAHLEGRATVFSPHVSNAILNALADK